MITIHTPALREQKENIEILTAHFLKQAELLAKKSGMGFSKGAMEKMRAYHWPGNVRELMNVITHAVVMADGKIIHADDIVLESEEPGRKDRTGESGYDHSARTSENQEGGGLKTAPDPSGYRSQLFRTELNPRQVKVCEILIQEREITRSRYQEVIGGDMSPRTAIYDLHDLVKKGILKKVGRGPSTRYKLVSTKS